MAKIEAAIGPTKASARAQIEAIGSTDSFSSGSDLSGTYGKGWWRPDHPSYSKVESFRYSFPNIQFQVVVKDKDGWSCQ